MAVETLPKPEPIMLEFHGEKIEVHVGDYFTLYNRSGFRLEGATGGIHRYSTGRETPVLLFSYTGSVEDNEDIYFPRVKSEQEGNFYAILGDIIASAVLERRKNEQKQFPQ